MKVFKYLRAIISGLFWGGAIYFTANDKNKIALVLIAICEKVTLKVDEEILLLKGFILASLGKDLASYIYINSAVKFLDASNNLNCDEKNYLRAYSATIIKKLRVEGKDIPVFESYELSSVANHFKTNFPVAPSAVTN